MYNNNDNGFGCGYGGVGLLVLLIFFAMFANGRNGGGWFGGGNGNDGAATAAATEALISQSNMRSQVSGISSRQEWQGQLLGGAVQGIERTRDAVAAIDTKLCQLGNDIANQIHGLDAGREACCCKLENLLYNKFCETNRHIDDSKNEILQVIQQNKFEALQNENQNLKVALATQQANCAREADTRQILNRIDDVNCCGCNTRCGNGCGNWGNRCGCGCGNNTFEQQLLTAFSTMNATQQAILAKLPGTTTTTPTA